jgi:hypothetical protein
MQVTVSIVWVVVRASGDVACAADAYSPCAVYSAELVDRGRELFSLKQGSYVECFGRKCTFGGVQSQKMHDGMRASKST